MDRIGAELVRDAKKSSQEEKDGMGKSRDLLSLLMKSNMNTDIPEHQRMSDEDVLARQCIPEVELLTVTDSILDRNPDFLRCRTRNNKH